MTVVCCPLQELSPRNALDASAPTRRRGKEREEAKRKRPSALRRVLVREREERRQLMEHGKEVPLE